jgi:glutaredoxin-like protein NrdH
MKNILDYSKKVEGNKKGDILLFTLSTCVWCKKTKALLKDLRAEYRYIDVDMLDGESLKNVEKEFKRWNSHESFPTIVLNNERCLIGFQEEELRKFVEDGK